MIDVEKLDNTRDGRVAVGALLALVEHVLETCAAELPYLGLMQAAVASLWPYAEDAAVSSKDVFDRYDDRVSELEFAMRATPTATAVYLAFAFTFYFCLWCIDAANWRAGLPTTNSETVAEMSELTIRKIAEYALETRAATEKAVEEYFGRIIAELCNDNAALSRAVFAKYKPILAAPIP